MRKGQTLGWDTGLSQEAASQEPQEETSTPPPTARESGGGFSKGRKVWEILRVSTQGLEEDTAMNTTGTSQVRKQARWG
jgi:hypothetical protein